MHGNFFFFFLQRLWRQVRAVFYNLRMTWSYLQYTHVFLSQALHWFIVIKLGSDLVLYRHVRQLFSWAWSNNSLQDQHPPPCRSWLGFKLSWPYTGHLISHSIHVRTIFPWGSYTFPLPFMIEVQVILTCKLPQIKSLLNSIWTRTGYYGVSVHPHYRA